MRRIELVIVLLVAVVLLSSCDRKAEASNSAGSSPPTAAQPGTAAVPPAGTPATDPSGTAAVSTPTSPVARIVYLDKQNCCDCTRRAQGASWTAIQEALGGASIPVETIHFDTQADRAASYRSLRPMMASPGIYFLDAAGGLVDMLQGEVTADAVRAILFP